MEAQCQHALTMMQLPPNIRNTPEAEAAGLEGTISMFPSLFRFVATLQREKRTFALLFRSFGEDLVTIKKEWNAFCELRHPLFSPLIADIGPFDGSVPGVPDRRIHEVHTLYRDADGPTLILETITNGPPEKTWDSWASAKPRPTEDLRNGREFINKVLKCGTVSGIPGIQRWMREHLSKQGTSAIKDDWAWWKFNREVASAGKLMTLLGGDVETKQIFFDDNVKETSQCIVDVRDLLTGKSLAIEPSQSQPNTTYISKYMVQVDII
jgi:hypothetical protein